MKDLENAKTRIFSLNFALKIANLRLKNLIPIQIIYFHLGIHFCPCLDKIAQTLIKIYEKRRFRIQMVCSMCSVSSNFLKIYAYFVPLLGGEGWGDANFYFSEIIFKMKYLQKKCWHQSCRESKKKKNVSTSLTFSPSKIEVWRG